MVPAKIGCIQRYMIGRLRFPVQRAFHTDEVDDIALSLKTESVKQQMI